MATPTLPGCACLLASITRARPCLVWQKRRERALEAAKSRRAHCEALQARCDDMHARHEEMRTRCEGVQTQCDGLQARCGSLEAQRGALQTRSQDAQARLEAAAAELAAERQARADLVDGAHEAQRQSASLQRAAKCSLVGRAIEQQRGWGLMGALRRWRLACTALSADAAAGKHEAEALAQRVATEQGEATRAQCVAERDALFEAEAALRQRAAEAECANEELRTRVRAAEQEATRARGELQEQQQAAESLRAETHAELQARSVAAANAAAEGTSQRRALQAAISELEASYAQSQAAATAAAASATEARAAAAAAVSAAEGSELEFRRMADGRTAQLGRGQHVVLRCLLDGRCRAACGWAWAHWRHTVAACTMDEMVKAEVARIRQSAQGQRRTLREREGEVAEAVERTRAVERELERAKQEHQTTVAALRRDAATQLAKLRARLAPAATEGAALQVRAARGSMHAAACAPTASAPLLSPPATSRMASPSCTPRKPEARDQAMGAEWGAAPSPPKPACACAPTAREQPAKPSGTPQALAAREGALGYSAASACEQSFSRSAEHLPSNHAAAHGKSLGQARASAGGGRRASSPSSSARRQAGREGGGKAALEAQPPTAAELAPLRKLVAASYGKDGRLRLESVSLYSMGKLLGKGAFGAVKVGVHKLSGAVVAIKNFKKVDVKSEVEAKAIEREVRILKQSNHQHIIRLYEVIDSQTNHYLVMECATHGDLGGHIERCKRLGEAEAARYFVQTVEAVAHCHEHGVIHRDIKPENLLLDARYDIKLTDFGLSAVVRPGQLLKVPCGTPAYSAPELVCRKEYDGTLSDVWSLGVLLYFMLVGDLPFPDTARIRTGEFAPRSELTPPGALALIRRVLVVQAEHRAGLAEVRQHEWLQEWRHTALRAPQRRFGLTYDEPDASLLSRLEERFGMRAAHVAASLRDRDFNHATATYLLVEEQRLDAEPET